MSLGLASPFVLFVAFLQRMRVRPVPAVLRVPDLVAEVATRGRNALARMTATLLPHATSDHGYGAGKMGGHHQPPAM